jgi:hypothetical protein
MHHYLPTQAGLDEMPSHQGVALTNGELYFLKYVNIREKKHPEYDIEINEKNIHLL